MSIQATKVNHAGLKILRMTLAAYRFAETTRLPATHLSALALDPKMEEKAIPQEGEVGHGGCAGSRFLRGFLYAVAEFTPRVDDRLKQYFQCYPYNACLSLRIWNYFGLNWDWPVGSKGRKVLRLPGNSPFFAAFCERSGGPLKRPVLHQHVAKTAAAAFALFYAYGNVGVDKHVQPKLQTVSPLSAGSSQKPPRADRSVPYSRDI